jgi:hypothetical protein
MPWEVVIQLADGAEPGEVASVCDRMTAALPGIYFYTEPSGPEKIAAAREMGVEFPEVIRKHMEQRPATLQADFQGDEFSMRFYGFESQPLRTIYVEVRGSGNPLPALAALCRPHGWIAVDCASGQPLDFAGQAAAGWEAFQSCRDRAVRSILESEEPS